MLRHCSRALPLFRVGQRTIYSGAKNTSLLTFRPFESLTPLETQRLMKSPTPETQSTPTLKGDIVLSYLEKENSCAHDPVPFYIGWNTVNAPKPTNESEDMSLESTKRKRKRKMNKHKHRKNLKKMKFTLRKIGRK